MVRKFFIYCSNFILLISFAKSLIRSSLVQRQCFLDFKRSCSSMKNNEGDVDKIIGIGSPIKSIILKSMIGSFLLGGACVIRPTLASDGTTYVDNVYRFSVEIPPSWTTMQRKTPTPTMLKFQIEQVLLTASSFAEASSLSVTKSYASQLLKDFNIDWWFSPLNSILDVGSPQLIAQILILQRQGLFEKQITPSQITNAAFVRSNKGEDWLQFEFNTPLAEGITRETIAKAFFRDGSLYVIWVSALTSVMEGDYGQKLRSIRESFVSTSQARNGIS